MQCPKCPNICLFVCLKFIPTISKFIVVYGFPNDPFMRKCQEDPDWCEAVRNEVTNGGRLKEWRSPAFLKKADMEVWSNSRCSQHKSGCGEAPGKTLTR